MYTYHQPSQCRYGFWEHWRHPLCLPTRGTWNKGEGPGACGKLYPSNGAHNWQSVGYGKETRFDIRGTRCSPVGKSSSHVLHCKQTNLYFWFVGKMLMSRSDYQCTTDYFLIFWMELYKIEFIRTPAFLRHTPTAVLETANIHCP